MKIEIKEENKTERIEGGSKKERINREERDHQGRQVDNGLQRNNKTEYRSEGMLKRTENNEAFL